MKRTLSRCCAMARFRRASGITFVEDLALGVQKEAEGLGVVKVRQLLVFQVLNLGREDGVTPVEDEVRAVP